MTAKKAPVSAFQQRQQQLDSLWESVSPAITSGEAKSPSAVQAWLKVNKRKDVDYNTARTLLRRAQGPRAGRSVGQSETAAVPTPAATQSDFVPAPVGYAPPDVAPVAPSKPASDYGRLRETRSHGVR